MVRNGSGLLGGASAPSESFLTYSFPNWPGCDFYTCGNVGLLLLDGGFALLEVIQKLMFLERFWFVRWSFGFVEILLYMFVFQCV